jgi:hypothetical protein
MHSLPPVTRLLLVLLAAGALAGAAAAASRDPVERHTPADMAKARAMMLKRTDLGAGWTRDTSPSPDEDCKAFDPDESKLVETGAADTFFERGAQLISSDAVVYRTEAMAKASWALNAKLAGMECFLEGLRPSLPPDVRVTVLRRARLAFPQVAPRTMAFTLAVRLTGPNGVVRLDLDVVLMGRGRALTGLVAVGIGARVPLAEERRLAALIARRMA